MGIQKKRFMIILGAGAGLILLIYIAGSIFFRYHFFINTEINGHSFSGKTVSSAEHYLTEQVKEYRLTLQEMNNQKETIKGSDIGLAYQPNKQLKNVLKAQNPFLWPKALFSRESAGVTIDLTYDKKALGKAVSTLNAVTGKHTAPISAHPEFDGSQFVVKPEADGTAVDTAALEKHIVAAIMRFRPKMNLEKEGCYAVPKYTAKSAKVQKACDQMNSYLKASITYPMNPSVVVDKALISSWLTVSDDMGVVFDEARNP